MSQLLPAKRIQPDKIDCCAYYRECSDSRTCLYNDSNGGVDCTYKRHLAAGKVFYGKSADGFSSEAYSALCETVSGLAEVERNQYIRFLHYFFQLNYLVEVVTCDKAELPAALINAGLLMESDDTEQTLSARLDTFVYTATIERNKEAAKSGKPKVKREQVKAELLSALDINHYTVVTYKQANRKYYLEYYLDWERESRDHGMNAAYMGFDVPEAIMER